MHSQIYCIYILANQPYGTLYIGVTSNLKRRIWEHKHRIIDGFTKKYSIHNLVYFEEYANISEAIAREKFLKGKNRKYKIALIESENPLWIDLYT